MRTVFSNDMVAHVWAQRTQSHGRNSTGSFYFNGMTIYSYGSHFPIARFVQPGAITAVLFTHRSYSNSTAKHIIRTQQAVGYNRKYIFYVADPSSDNHEEHRADYEQRILATLEQASRARQRKADYLAHYADLVNEANRYAELFEQSWRFTLAEDVTLALETAREEQRKREEEQAKRERERLDAIRIVEASRYTQWRNGEPVQFPRSFTPNDGTALLTLTGDTIRTSLGAEVPATHARRLWARLLPIVDLVQRLGAGSVTQPSEDTGHAWGIGHFRIDRIEPNDTHGILVYAGCHRIAWAEIERMAHLLGLLNESAA